MLLCMGLILIIMNQKFHSSFLCLPSLVSHAHAYSHYYSYSYSSHSLSLPLHLQFIFSIFDRTLISSAIFIIQKSVYFRDIVELNKFINPLKIIDLHTLAESECMVSSLIFLLINIFNFINLNQEISFSTLQLVFNL